MATHLSPKARNTIEKAIKRFVAYLRYVSGGPHLLTKEELIDLARHGMISKPSKVAVSNAYLKTHALAAGKKNAAPKVMRDGAIEFLERMFSSYAQKAGNDLKTDLMATIESHLMPMFDRKEGEMIFQTLKDKDRYSKNMAAALRGKVDNWQHRWRTIVTTELNRASNWGSMDAIIHNNPDKKPNDILVYKLGPNDEATCKYCKEFWFWNGTNIPRIYRLSELMENGSNIGKKARDWKPTVDSTHPNERHILHELSPGWGFSASGEISYIGKDHDEFTRQRGLTKSDELEKGIARDAAIAAGLVAGIAGGAIETSRTAHITPPIIKPKIPDLHDELRHIAFIESSGGKNKNHAMTTVGVNKGHTAAGSTGLMPIMIKETIEKNPILRQKYSYILKMHHSKITKFINDNPHIEHEVANTHWNRLNRIFGNDGARKAYAWRNGITGSIEASQEEVMAHPYVQKFLNLANASKKVMLP